MDRSKAREFSFQYLFHLQLPIFEETKKELSTSQDDLKESLTEFMSTSDLDLSPGEMDLAVDHIATTAQHTQSLEERIIPYLKNWKIERISKVDRTILILAVNELCYLPQTPQKVVINEAVELAKKYGTEDSPKFVNGILNNFMS